MQIEIVQIVKKCGCFFRLWKFVGVSALDIGSDGSGWVQFKAYMLPWTTASSVVMLKFTCPYMEIEVVPILMSHPVIGLNILSWLDRLL